MKTKKISIKTKALLLTIFACTLLGCVSLGISYKVYGEMLVEQYTNCGENIAAMVAGQLNPKEMSSYITTLEKDDNYQEIEHYLRETAAYNDAECIYVKHIVGEEATYLFDTDESNLRCELGTKEVFSTIFKAADMPKDKTYSYISKNENDYGWLVASFAPVLDDNGNQVALVGVDISMQQVLNKRNHFMITTAIILLIMTFMIATFMFLYLDRQLVIPIKKIAHATSAYIQNETQEKISLISSLDIHSGDEMELLSGSIKKMELDIQQYIENLTRITSEKERIGAELEIASKIQISMLPNKFPAFPERNEFQIYATMEPAKEVGGDFYDFFLIDENHIAMVMADVSGKGIPAALFMVRAKTAIKNQLLQGGEPSEVLIKVNNQLCENNDTCQFVTVWIGVMEISSGHILYANAGHEMPLVRRTDGTVEFVKNRPQMVLAGMEDMMYKTFEMQLSHGELLYLYTDGVPEATNKSEELFGNERMLAAFAKNKELEPKDLLKAMKQDVDEFVGDAPQFDDITMLGLWYR